MNPIRKPLLAALALALVAPMAFAATADKAMKADATATADMSAKKSWADLDGDKDGNLTKAEAAVVPSLAEVFDKADANADGSLTGDEYRTYVDANAAKSGAGAKAGGEADAGN